MLILTLVLLILYFKSKKKIIFNILKINVIIFVTISILPIGKIGLKYLEKDYIKQSKIENIENIIVLAGAEDLISTNISNKLNFNGSSERLILSISLANKFLNSKIFYIGGNGYLIKNNLTELSVAKKFYKEMGFNMDKISFIGNTRNTIENFNQIKKLNLKSTNTVLITSAFHMKRSMMIAKKLNLKPIPYAVDFRSISNPSLINYYQRFSISSNLLSFDLFLREIIGILAFKVLI